MLARSCLRSTRAFASAKNGAVRISKVCGFSAPRRGAWHDHVDEDCNNPIAFAPSFPAI